MAETTPQPDPRRKAALKRVRAKQQFWRSVAVWAIVSVFMVFIWLISGRGYFWPIWVIGGMALGLVFMALNVFTGNPPSEDRIQQEMDKM